MSAETTTVSSCSPEQLQSPTSVQLRIGTSRKELHSRQFGVAFQRQECRLHNHLLDNGDSHKPSQGGAYERAFGLTRTIDHQHAERQHLKRDREPCTSVFHEPRQHISSESCCHLEVCQYGSSVSKSLRPWASRVSRCAVTSLSQAPARQVNTTVRKRRNWERNKDSCKETRKTSRSIWDNSLVKLGSSRAAMKAHRAKKRRKPSSSHTITLRRFVYF